MPLATNPHRMPRLVFTLIYLLLISVGHAQSIGLTDKCAMLLRKAQIAADKGQTKQAFKLINRVDKKCPNNNEVALAGCQIAQQLGYPKKAYAFVAQVKAKGAVSDTARVKLAIWRGMYAFELGLRYAATRNFKDALHKLQLYDIDDPHLYSIVKNNLGVAYIFNQSLNNRPKQQATKSRGGKRASQEPTGDEGGRAARHRPDTTLHPKGAHFTKIHLRDFDKAARLFREALRAEPTNCPARQNLTLCESVRSVYDTASTRGYISYDQLQRLNFQIDTCALAPLQGESTVKRSTVTVLAEELAASDEIVLLMDVSGSMRFTVAGGGERRFDAMLQAAVEVVELLDTTQLVGGLTIGGDCGVPPQLEFPVASGDHRTLSAAIQELKMDGKTPLDQRIIRSFSLFSPRKRRQKTLLLFTDGVGNCGRANLCALAGEMAKRRIRLVVYAMLLENDENAQAYANYACLVTANGGSIYGVSRTQEIEDRTFRIDDQPFSIQVDQASINAGQLKGVLSRQFRNDP